MPLLIAAIVLALVVGAVLATVLTEQGVLVLAFAGVLTCILLGCATVFRNGAIRYRGGLSGFLTGHLQLVASVWSRPLTLTWQEWVLIMVAASLLGAFARILWLAYA
jgi:hypothetical protein